jgi:spermidine synthase
MPNNPLSKNRNSRQAERLLILVYFFSGACALAYEVIWQRLLKLTLGNTTYATSVTVSVFMIGLAIGSLVVRHRADRFSNPVRIYSIIEFLIAGFSCAMPLILSAGDALYVLAFRRFAPSPAALLGLQVIISAFSMIIPAALMGSTLPILSTLIIRNREKTGSGIGVLYGFNTLGAMVGAAATGFLLIRSIGTYPTYFIAVSVNCFLAAAAYMLSLRATAIPGKGPEKTYEIPRRQDDAPPRMLIDLWLFISGFIALGYEIIWVRTASQSLYSEVYTFAAILCVYLAAYAFGVWCGGIITRSRRYNATTAAVTFQLVGIAGILYIPYLVLTQDFTAQWYLALRSVLLRFDSYVVVAVESLILFAVPSFIMGLNFPMLIHLRRRSWPHDQTGDAVAGAYMLNTIGGVLGSLVAGFVLVPLVGATTGIELLGGTGVAAGASAMMALRGTRSRIALTAAIAVSVLSLAVTPAHLYERWINSCLSRGHRPMKLVDMIEGVNTTASVHEYFDTKEKIICSSGMDVAGDSRELRQTQKVQGHVPVILHGNPKEVLTVGFGSGELTKLLTLHRIPRITCVEIAPEMVVLSKRHFRHLNLGDSLERKITMVYMDARNFMHLTDKRFDVIMNDCTWPGYSDASSALYTKEYFLDGKRRLSDGGVYSTWLPTNIPELSLRSIIRTFDSVFENTILVYPHADLSQHMILVGQKKAHPYSYTAMESQFDIPEVKESLRTIGVEGVDDVIDMILAQSATMKELVRGLPINSDNFPVVEYDVNRSRTVLDANVIVNRFLLLITTTSPADLAGLLTFAPMSDSESALILDTLKRNQEALQYYFAAHFARNPDKAMQLVEKGLTIAPNNSGLLGLRKLLTAGPPRESPEKP